MFQRIRYQFGWLRRKPRRRGPDVWVWVHRSKGPTGKAKENAVIVGNVAQYPTEAEAWRATEGLRLATNTAQGTPTRFRHIFLTRRMLQKKEEAKGGNKGNSSRFCAQFSAARVTTGLCRG
jgi:hypothetical protein